MTDRTCKARQHSDQMLCSCGLAWDVTEPDPHLAPVHYIGAAAILRLREQLGGPDTRSDRNLQIASYMMGEFKPDTRDDALFSRLLKYYNDTPDSMCNQVAARHWRAFREWARDGGYTTEEINRAKRRVQSDLQP